jgi:CRISPR/Cas system-associated exonuclease Cas4 (RecB family)
VKHGALAQVDLYGFFFKRQNKRVQIYIMDQKETVTCHEKVDENEAVTVLRLFKELDEGQKAIPPQKWKCNSCKYRETCRLEW